MSAASSPKLATAVPALETVLGAFGHCRVPRTAYATRFLRVSRVLTDPAGAPDDAATLGVHTMALHLDRTLGQNEWGQLPRNFKRTSATDWRIYERCNQLA